MAKYALTLTTELLATLERDPAPVRRDATATVLEDVIARCVAAKAGIVAEDERDASARLVLNYGHTLGHALERLDAFEGRTHGEAVALGMVFAAALAEARGLALGLARADRAAPRLARARRRTATLPPVDEVLRCLRLDKKYRDGVRFVLLEDVGRPIVVDDVSDDGGGSRPARDGSARMKVLYPVRSEPRRAGTARSVPLRIREPRGDHGRGRGASHRDGTRGRSGGSPITRGTSSAGSWARRPRTSARSSSTREP